VGFLVTVLLCTTVGAERPEEEEAFDSSEAPKPEAGLKPPVDLTNKSPVTLEEKKITNEVELPAELDPANPPTNWEDRVNSKDDPASAPKPADSSATQSASSSGENEHAAPAGAAEPAAADAVQDRAHEADSSATQSVVSTGLLWNEHAAPAGAAEPAAADAVQDRAHEAEERAKSSAGTSPEDAEAAERKRKADFERLQKDFEAETDLIAKEKAQADQLARKQAAAEQVQAETPAQEEAEERENLSADTAPQDEDAANGVKVLSPQGREEIEAKARQPQFELGQKKGFDDLTASYKKMSETYKAASDIAWTNPESSDGKKNRIEQSGKNWMEKVNEFRQQSSNLKATAEDLSKKIVHAHEFAAKQQQETFKQEKDRLQRLLRNHNDIPKTSGDHATDGDPSTVEIPEDFFKENQATDDHATSGDQANNGDQTKDRPSA
jgi:hypothetical protein